MQLPCQAEQGTREFSVEPRTLTHTSLLRVTFPRTHPKKFAIRDPNGEWFYVVDDAKSYSYIKPKAFVDGHEFELRVTKIRGIHYTNGKESIEQVFRSSGGYLLYFADNVDTEPDNTFEVFAIVQFQW
jgi:hypothetical protein